MSGSPNQVNVLIVDDERDACENMRTLLSEYVGTAINVLGVANNTREAEFLINKVTPDAVFLDIEMPNENAFQFLERVSPVNFEVIFVTAYDDYAIRAFKLNAVDYIMKPISIPELLEAVKKLSARIEYKRLVAAGPTSYADISRIASGKARGSKITLKDAHDIEVVDFKSIFFLEAQGSYSRVLFSKNNTTREKTMSISLSDYEELMPTDMFYRIHKSYLINCVHVKKIIREEVGQVVINNEFTLPVSRRRMAPLIEFLKSYDYYDG